MSTAVAVVALATGVGCGEQSGSSDPRPPAPESVSAAVVDHRITVSPQKIGGGPITLLVANLSSKSVDVTLESVGGNEAPASTGPINPQDTASVAVDVREGSYKLAAKPSSAKAAVLKVGSERASAQNDLLLP
jgi:hypothetical protein